MTIILLQHPKAEIMGAHHYVHIRTAVGVEGERRNGEPSVCLLCPPVHPVLPLQREFVTIVSKCAPTVSGCLRAQHWGRLGRGGIDPVPSGLQLGKTRRK